MRTTLLALLLFSCSAIAAVEKVAEDGSGLPGWRWEGGGSSFTFNQRLPDQTRAFFMGRGFSPEQVEPLAANCVFQAIIRNSATAPTPVALNLAEWHVIPASGNTQPLRLEAQWQAEWEKRSVAQPARIAFRWALFPTLQRFEPGDWNMGMITFGLPPGSHFDLEVVWHAGDELRRQRFTDMYCATDQ